MFINQLFTGGIRALLDADNTIFDGMVVPSGVSVSDVVDNILLHYGDAPLFVTDPAVMKFYITKWSKKRLTQWTRFYKTITLDYNPIENYDRTEERNSNYTYGHNIKTDDDLKHGLNVENLTSADNATTYQADNKSIDSGTDERDINERHSGVDNNKESIRAHGNIGITSNQTMVSDEVNLIPKLNLIDFITDDFHNEFCLYLY